MFQPVAVGLVESVELVAVDVEHGDDGAVGVVDGDDDFAARGTGAGNVAWELVNIGDDLCLVFLPCGSAYAATFADAGTGEGTLEGTEHEGVGIGYAVKAYPPPAEGLVEHGGGVGHVCDGVGFVGNDRLNLG